jgi:hypothetical protein
MEHFFNRTDAHGNAITVTKPITQRLLLPVQARVTDHRIDLERSQRRINLDTGEE